MRRGNAEQGVDPAAEQAHRDAVRRLPAALVGRRRDGGRAAVEPLGAGDVLVGLDVEQLEGLAIADLRRDPCSQNLLRDEGVCLDLSRVMTVIIGRRRSLVWSRSNYSTTLIVRAQ